MRSGRAPQTGESHLDFNVHRWYEFGTGEVTQGKIRVWASRRRQLIKQITGAARAFKSVDLVRSLGLTPCSCSDDCHSRGEWGYLRRVCNLSFAWTLKRTSPWQCVWLSLV